MQASSAVPTVAAPLEKSQSRSERLASIDIVRGIAMVIMLIAHSAWSLSDVSFRLHYGWDRYGNVDLTAHPEGWMGLLQGSPIFFLLAGFGLALFESAKQRKGWTNWQITRFMLIRGTILIALDIFVLPWDFHPKLVYTPHTYFVLLTIGLCIWCIAFLRRFSVRQLAFGALALTLITQVIYKSVAMPTDTNLLRALLLYPSPTDTVILGFPVLPWLAVMLLGFISARLVVQKLIDFKQYTLWLGLGLLGIWVVITLLNDFGRLYTANPLITTKHPPMLDYLTFYIGIAFLLLSAFTRFKWLANSPPARFLSMLGQTSLFYYLAHFYLTMILAFVLKKLPAPELLISAIIVLVALPILFVACRYYRRIRDQYPNSVLQYL